MIENHCERGLHAVIFNTSHDKISFSSSPNRFGSLPQSPSSLQFGLQSPRFYSTPTLYSDRASAISSDRLSGSDSVAGRLVGFTQTSGDHQTPALLDPLLCRKKNAKKNSFDDLLKVIFRRARQRKLIGRRPQIAVDATGLESRYVSRYYVWRRGYKRFDRRQWPKLTVACHTRTHLLPGAFVSWGPSQDSPQFAPVLRQAATKARWDQVLGDTAYDAEHNHVLCRDILGIRSTVIPAQRRNSLKWPKAKYRRQMKKRFFRKIYGQRWQVESAFSRHKRLLGAFLRSRNEASQFNECLLRVLTHNLMILWCVSLCFI